MENCIFCKILSGEIPSYKIYEDEFCYAFLDIANDIEGHTLVIPKKHCKNVMDCDEETLAKVIAVCKKIGNHYVNDCGFDGFNILNASGESAEQTVFHLHFHILPRKNGDNFSAFPNVEKQNVSLEETCKKLAMISK